MFTKFQIKKALFQDQIHERFSFSVNVQGNDYQGLYHNGSINWFNPQPFNKLEEEQLNQIEADITDKMEEALA